MNREKVNAVIQQYIEKFDTFNDVNGFDEGYKWRAISNFKKHWDIAAEDFAAMFDKAVELFENLIDEKFAHPLQAFRKLFEFKETEFVREQFRTLFYTDDSGDLEKRQDRIDCFVEAINNQVNTHVSSKIFQISRRTAIFFLNAYCPEDNFIYKATEATNWATDMEFASDIGGGASFSLKAYYRMCYETLEIMKESEEFLALNLKRFQKEAVGFDDELHIAVFDLIYCYDSYMISPYDKGLTIKQKKEKSEAKKNISSMQQELSQVVEEAEKLESEIKSLQAKLDSEGQLLSGMKGCAVSHKKYGDGIVISVNTSSGILTHEVKFQSVTQTFQCSIVYGKGFLSTGDTSKDKAIAEAADMLKDLKNKLDELAKLQEKSNGMKVNIADIASKYHIE